MKTRVRVVPEFSEYGVSYVLQRRSFFIWYNDAYDSMFRDSLRFQSVHKAAKYARKLYGKNLVFKRYIA
jgi:hypothetical protein